MPEGPRLECEFMERYLAKESEWEGCACQPLRALKKLPPVINKGQAFK
jgi:hypothetical protein